MFKISILQLALFTILSLNTGCFWFTSKNDGENLKQEVTNLKDRLTQVESEQQEKLANFTAMIDKARSEVDKLENTLLQATRVLTRNSADFGADMENLKKRLREIDGSLAEMRHEMEQSMAQIESTNKKIIDVASAAGLDIPVDASKVPAEPDVHFKMIVDSFSAGRWGEVRSLAALFVEKHPRHKSVEDAQLYSAKSNMSQRRWSRALGPLRTFTETYPNSPKMPEALYLMAECFYNMGDCTDARILLDAVNTKYKESPFAEKARALAETIRKNKSQCKS